MKVIIVESPTKAKTIQGFVGKVYQVISSMGHVIDLPPKEFGVDVGNDFTPHYVILKRDVAQKLKEIGSKAKLVILATDPDREGEAIAYHIKSLIKSPTRRAIFYEITRKSIEESLKNLSEIDLSKVESQQARRILDRLVGYEISPLLWRIFHKQELSAGRVQSVALRLICEREKEIREFTPEEYWEITCKFNGKRPFNAKLVEIKIANEKEANKVEIDLNQQMFVVELFTKEDKKRAPFPPYITSTLQQDASARLKFSTKQTMMIAQQLFEGIELGKSGRVGLITYMRTDSLRVATHAIVEAKEYITKEFGDKYLPQKPRRYEKKEGAHEAIRPTSVKRTPESISQYLNASQVKLYSLIWKRFVASQMVNAVYEHRKIDIKGGKYKLSAKTENLKFDGFTKVYYMESKKEEVIPELSKGTKLTLLEVMKEQKFTHPKPRYTEGTMVKELDSKGIGRPSTYAPIISKIIERKYVAKVEGKLVPTDLGEVVNKILVAHFPGIFNIDFTRKMEDNLDKIESNETDRVTVLKTFYKPFKEDVIKFTQSKKEVRKEITEVTEEMCNLCGNPMVIKWGRHGRFVACSGFPQCRNTKPLETKPITLGIKCPECSSELIQRRAKKGKIFYGCSNYPKCRFAVWYKPVDKECPSCEYSIMTKRKWKLVCPKCSMVHKLTPDTRDKND